MQRPESGPQRVLPPVFSGDGLSLDACSILRRNPEMRSDQIENGIKLLVGLVGFAAKPGFLGAFTTALSSRDLAKKIIADAPADIKRLADQLTDSAQEVFDGFKHDLPPDADLLYAQMVEFGLPTPQQVVTERMNAGDVTDAMLERLTLTEHVKGHMPGLFRDITKPTLEKLLADRSFADSLTPAYMAEVLQDLERQAKLIQDLEAKFGSLAKALDHLSSAKRDQLELLAERFRLEDVRQSSNDALMAVLSEKAEELRKARLIFASLDPKDAALARLKAEADAAAERLDFAAVEWALAQVDQARTKDAEAAKLARAENALLNEETALAARLLVAAAESFGGKDPLAPARKRLEYLPVLLNHGVRFGLPALKEARGVAENAAEAFAADLKTRQSTDQERYFRALHAQALTFLGIAQFEIGQKEDHETGRTAMNQAIDHYRSAIHTFDAIGLDGEAAIARNNLGTALRTLGTRTDGDAGTVLLHEAEQVLITACGHNDMPENMAVRKSNLGVTQTDLAMRFSGKIALDRFKEAHATLSAAMDLERASGRDSSTSSTNLPFAVVRIEQGRRTSGMTGRDWLTEALGLLENAEAALPRKKTPQLWALVAFTRATALYHRAMHDTSDNPCSDLLAARTHLTDALSEFTEARAPFNRKRAMLREDQITAALFDAGCVD
ncbi:cell envelope integrity protein TolA [Gymnodinialimonas ceratoperidinii]|uniref:Uncharacterized protein n=1 Tax=Gymnodinialimonas ceratoperidinii TaxID=2856823 RepID=A0A8F6YC38_9RHOB|nr:cell envelope integrity protein TolA [Gymnodinialimonas ceratoperidinii]QXT41168.1 hypothetical protein KYE46_08155 [Gymnodinialimonas ceratoperidinii]